MKEPSPTFCVLPWNHLYTSPWGRPSLCCVATEAASDEGGHPINLQTHSFEAIWNSGYYREVRRKMYEGERLEACRLCYTNEENSIRSYREWANQHWLRDRPTGEALRESIDRSALRDFEADKPVSFDLRVGNLCNLKCRMCNAGSSSQIEKDPVHSKWRPHDEPEKFQHRFGGSPDADWSESPLLLEELKSLADRIEFIQLAGGEPTMNRTQTEWLRYLCETGRAQGIQLIVYSNLTNVRDEYFQMLSQFQSTRLFLSVDGFGSTYEYIRFPARWNQFEKNVHRAAGFPRISLTVVPVLQAYNILDITDLYRWADEQGLGSQMNPLDAPPYLSSAVLPAGARQLAKRRIDAYVATLRTRAHNTDFAAALEGFGQQITEASYGASADRIRDFWQFTKELDDSRDQSLQASCPELFALMSEGEGDETRLRLLN